MIPGAVEHVSPDDRISIDIPDKLLPFMEPHRFKVAYGGRGGGKSHTVAQLLLAMAYRNRMRILCTREVQKSIRDSVKRLLDDAIERLGLGWFYKSLDTEIRGLNGSEFLFAGLSTATADSLKSMEGVDVCWCEEAHSITEESWRILTPTIRKPDSEIWITFNPSLDTDPVWKRYVESPPPDSVVVRINHSDNPWFPEVLEQDRLHCKATMPDADYQNIWEGVCRPSVEGAIYATEVQEALQDNRITTVPYNPRLKVHAIWDLGWNDSTSIVLVQRNLNQLAVIGYIEDSQKTLEHYANILKAQPYNWGYNWLPHDASTRNLQTGLSAHDVLKRLGLKTRPVPQIGLENGIRALRMIFSRLYFDKAKTERLIECLRRYRRGIPTSTGEPGSPVHDAYSHGADAARYMAVVADRLTNEDEDLAPSGSEIMFRPQLSDMGY